MEEIKMDAKKSAKKWSGVHNYWVCYQPKGDAFTHIRDFDNYDDALEFFNAVKVLHRENEIPVRIELTRFPDAPNTIGGSEKILFLDNTKDDEKSA